MHLKLVCKKVKYAFIAEQMKLQKNTGMVL